MAAPPFPLNGANKEPIPSRSTKLSALMESKHYKELTASLPGVDSSIFELATRFCFGHEVKFSPETAIPLACAAYHLEIPNLLQLSVSFFTTRVLPYWNETLRALNSATPILTAAHHLGLVNACLSSISEKALADPTLLDDPNWDSTTTEDGKSGVKRRLFTIDRFVDDLTALPLDVYAPAMSAIIGAGVPPERIAQSLYRYTRRWVNRKNMTANADDFEGDEIEKEKQREVVEAVERLLPSKKGAIHAHCLFEILRAAIYLQADTKCRDRLEARIGQQLYEASVSDLYIPCFGYTKETMFDMKCVVKMLGRSCKSWSYDELDVVTKLVEMFLADVAGDENLSKETFIGVLEVVVAMGDELKRSHDGVYRAIDVYLEAHRHLTDAERAEVCKVLDCWRLSGKACEHAAQNERMPMRLVAHVLFVGQMRIRETIAAAAATMGSSGRLSEEEQEKRVVVSGGKDGQVEGDMLKIDNRVMELERECVKMKIEIEKVELEGGRKEGKGFWTGMKGLLGCKGGAKEYSCPEMRKKHKKQKLNPKEGGGVGA